MIQIDTGPEGIELAKRRRAQMPESSKDSILKGEGTLAGVVAEIYSAKYFDAGLGESFQFDIQKSGRLGEVKTHRRNVIPRAHYMVRVCKKNDRQQCHTYIFCSILFDLSRLWIVGLMPREEFFQTAQEIEVGTKQDDGFIAKESCWQLRIAELYPVPIIASKLS